MLKFAKNLQPGDITPYGRVVANQLLWANKTVQLTLAEQSKNVYLKKYKIVRTNKG
ncbi:hypothetical protein SEA_YABOI_162 [Streptomyces phage Yaboi]|jgi:hypothetical protein|uniref:Uncharacterized protein n=3 Tax=Streptomyces virus Yaboi TaxID=2846408 RepID=A0A385UI80_9CAUD|nr:hypothetical protein HWB86_gp143 [Streptomyces phage Yaboi]QAY08801.1 hypothetical protein SEA_GENIE2_161 [Streptomyces phage Genie2]QAY12791.1 hypothetical protein SEA_BOOMERJR_161 [Streptomyces phage BoomerJR]UVD39984.1 hypothetical protein SEA_STANIMAL_159 [Streptomyces phage Stanimal]WNM73727.1 hypothetical protein SEA_SOLLERTIA_161 [Streptomyces phage Sollertia]AYB70976.1 hypothetical protein SEA_YABOI_162 [Streptomyces phage Yaboi]